MMDMMEQGQLSKNEGGRCLVCGDLSSGRHYGVLACFGCKGFFRRSIRSSQTYQCRFSKSCSIDKDQRNACRACRFNRCLQVGMEILAIRPDRDIIGKQKNPRKRKFKQEASCDQSPEPDSISSQQEDALLNYLLEIDSQQGISTNFMDESSQFFDSHIGIVRVKSEPEVSIYELFENRSVLESYMTPMRNDLMMRTASVEQLSQAMRGYAISAITWINALFSLAGVENTNEKCSVLKHTFSSFSAFQKAANTASISPDCDNLCLNNGSLIPRNAPRYLLDTNLLANKLVDRILDELVRPIRKLQLLEAERVALTALILLDADGCSSPQFGEALNQIRENIQTALFQFIRERCNHSLNAASSRFAKILLLLPSIAKISSLYNENFQLAKMFGCRSIDPLLDEILLENTIESNNQPALSPTTKIRMDAATQTGQPTLKLDEPLGLDAMSNSSTNSTLSSVNSIVDESSALENIISLGLEIEERAARRKTHPPPLIMNQQQPMVHEQHTPPQHCVSVPGYTNFYNFADVYNQNVNFGAGFNNNNNNSPPAIPHNNNVQQRGTQSAGLQMHGTHFADFFDQTVQHPSPPTNSYNNIH